MAAVRILTTACRQFVSRKVTLSLTPFRGYLTSPSSRAASADRSPDKNTRVTSSVKKERVKFGVDIVPAGDVENWTPIYRFNYIILARVIQRLKIFQTGITCFVFLPLAQLTDHATVADLALGVSVLACTMLCIMGTFSSRLVGIVYVHKDDPERLRIARLTFFGARVDTVMSANAFIPITDSNSDPGDAYVELVPVHRSSPEPGTLQYFLPFIGHQDKYYLSLRFGTVYQPNTFIRIFGDVSDFLSRRKQNKEEP